MTKKKILIATGGTGGHIFPALSLAKNLVKKYDIIKDCYKKAEHYISLASNSLSIFEDCEEKIILKNLTSFSINRKF